jgi:D-alanyl-D-alanine-carboxypeptidase/D-alanyl-D-alanine-endopeptidase
LKPSRIIPAILTFACIITGHATALAQTIALNTEQATVLGAELFAKSGSTGMVLVVVHDREVYIHGFGETALGNGQKPTADSILRLCSLSKIFATDLLTKLVTDNTVRLDDPLQLFAPPHVTVPSRSARGSDQAHPITLLELATHTSGLPREVGNAPHGTPHFTFPGYAYRWHWLPSQRLRTVPGTASAYSNVGFDFLGDALQQAAHKPYAKLLAERTTTPLGMRETGFTPTAEQCSRLLQGAHDEGPCTDTQASASSAGLYSTALDMSKWLTYLLGTGTIAQNPAAQAVYIQPETLVSQTGLDHAGKLTGVGLGWMHLQAPDGPFAITEKTGGGAGFLTYIALSQQSHTGIFLAVTDGAIETHINVFKEANNLLLALIGLPPLPPDPPKPVTKPARQKLVHKTVRPHKPH